MAFFDSPTDGRRVRRQTLHRRVPIHERGKRRLIALAQKPREQLPVSLVDGGIVGDDPAKILQHGTAGVVIH
jgi:hypothetical protein